MAQSAGFGLTIFAMLFQLAIYCAIAFVIWKFYQMISKISEDISAIRTMLKRHSGDPDLGLELPHDPLT
jgi:hypothetical protein